MTKESKEKLLMAYRAVCVAQMTSVAELLEDVILDVMSERTPSTVTRGNETTLEPPWTVTCGPDTVKLGTTVAGTGIDHTREVVTS